MTGSARGSMAASARAPGLIAALLLIIFLCTATILAATPASAAGTVTAKATLDGRAIAGAGARNPVRLDPSRVSQVVVDVANGTDKPISIRRVDVTGHVLGLNFFSYSTTVELTVAAGKTGKLTYRLDPAGLDGQATGLIGSDFTLIGSDGKPLTAEHTVVDVRGSIVSVYGLFGVIIAVLTALAIADAVLTVARHRLSANRWQRGLRLLAPGLGIGLMIGFTASVARWWVPGTALWLSLAGVVAAVFFLVGYLSPTPRQADDLGLDAEDLAAAKELDAHGYPAGPNAPGGSASGSPPRGATFPDLVPETPGGGGFSDPGFAAQWETAQEPGRRGVAFPDQGNRGGIRPETETRRIAPGSAPRGLPTVIGPSGPGEGPTVVAPGAPVPGRRVRYSGAGMNDSTVAGPIAPSGPRTGETTIGRSAESGDDEPTIRSVPRDSGGAKP